jgi:two-component system OmpR family response regulator
MKRALVVDDTKNIRNLLTTCLELNDFEVMIASNGEDALKLLLSETFDLVFLDIKMPEISGTKVLKLMRDASIDTPVIIMTAFATVKNAIDCTKLGAVAYLQKPFTLDKVNSVLSELDNIVPAKNNIDEYIEESKALMEEKKFDEAFIYLKKALSLDPSYEQCYFLIGKVHEAKGNFEEADKFYNIFRTFNSNK